MKAYPNLSTAIGGEEGGVCMGPAIVVMANGDGQCGCCCCWDCCWCPVTVSPLILSGGVNVPGIIPLPTSIRKDQHISTVKLHVYHLYDFIGWISLSCRKYQYLHLLGYPYFASEPCQSAKKGVKLQLRFYFYSHIIHFSWIKYSILCSLVLWENANRGWSVLLPCNHIHLFDIF